MNYFTGRFSKSGLWTLFLVVAFPIHVWALILIFRDISWVTERTNLWDAIGVAAYGLLIAFVESVFVFLVAVLLSFLLPKRWSEQKRVVLIGLLFWVVAAWGILAQLYFILEAQLPDWVIQTMTSYPHPVRLLYGVILVLVVPTVLLPVLAVIKWEKFTKGMWDIFERVATLGVLFLVLDFAALVIVIIRNV